MSQLASRAPRCLVCRSLPFADLEWWGSDGQFSCTTAERRSAKARADRIPGAHIAAGPCSRDHDRRRIWIGRVGLPNDRWAAWPSGESSAHSGYRPQNQKPNEVLRCRRRAAPSSVDSGTRTIQRQALRSLRQVEIVSLIVTTWPQHLDTVSEAVLALGNTEVHGRDPKGKLIVVIEEAKPGSRGRQGQRNFRPAARSVRRNGLPGQRR